jgi:hypothetical protein
VRLITSHRQKNKTAFRNVINQGPPPGLLAFDGKIPVSSSQCMLHDTLPWLERSLTQINNRPLWSVIEAYPVLRLAIPRRVYTQSHIDYLVKAILEINAHKKELSGFGIVEAPPFLRHFTAKFRPL